MSQPTVSAIIPAYRAAHVVGRAIDSVLAQTRPPREIVVVDDGSPDDTAAAVAPYGDRVRLLRKANGGAASARNFGIDYSDGDWIAFLDADDYWEPFKLERQLEIAARCPEVGVVGGRNYNQKPGEARVPGYAAHPSLYDRVQRASGPAAFEVARRIWTSTVLIRRDALGGERFDVGLGTAEDVDLWIRLVLKAPVYLTSDFLATGVLEGGSLSRANPAADSLNMLRVVRRYRDVLGPAGLRAWEATVFRDWAARYLGQGEPRAASAPAWNRLRLQPWSPQAWWIVFKSTALAALHGAPKEGAAPVNAECVNTR